MSNILTYSIQEELSVSDRFIVYRAFDEITCQNVILKLLNKTYPTPEEIGRFKNEYEISLLISKADAGLKVYSFEKYGNSFLLVLEDYPGIPLNRLNVQGSTNIGFLLKIALNIVEALEKIHQLNIIHKNICPSNILYSLQEEKIKIIDYGISTTLLREKVEAVPVNAIEGTLAYIAPEQTGRMNRGLDYRTDYYSLGVVFYELFTGELPFVEKNMQQLMYAHIARTPKALTEVNSSIHVTLSNIVMKLLSKNPEERYQSLLGLKYDLKKCYDLISEKGLIEEFLIAKHDVSYRMEIPEKLYGREKELEFLLNQFKICLKNVGVVVFVSGYAGIGKTLLINELMKVITKESGYLIKGNFDQMKYHKPYSGLMEVLTDKLKQILMESKENIEGWKTRFLKILDNNGKIITELLPQLTLIIGEQPEVSFLSEKQNQIRFKNTLKNFIQVLLASGPPTILFIDNLQWADLHSLQLLEWLAIKNKASRLFIAGSYRDNEITKIHPLISTISNIKSAQVNFHELALKPFSLDDICAIIVDSFHVNEKEASSLGELCYKKTRGNPFFLKQFLKMLYEKHYVLLNTHTGKWEWDIHKVNKARYTDNVVDLLIIKISSLPMMAQDILKFAACIGLQFDDETLFSVCQYPKDTIQKTLITLSNEEFIVPVGKIYKKEKQEELTIRFAFLHDRIRQAAHSLLEEDKKKEIHLRIGILLLEKLSKKQIESQIFKIVDHVNIAFDQSLSLEKKYQFAELNLIAGSIAKKSVVYNEAITYLSAGIQWLPLEKAWQETYDLIYRLYLEQAEVFMLISNYDDMDKCIQNIIENAHDNSDKAYAYAIRMQALHSQNKLQEYLKLFLNIMNDLGIKMSRNVNKLDVFLALIRTKFHLLGKTPDDLYHLPAVKDKKILAIHKIILSFILNGVFEFPEHYFISILLAINLTIKHGNSPWSAIYYSSFCIILCTVLERIPTGIMFDRLAFRLLESPTSSKDNFLVITVQILDALVVDFWVNPIHSTLKKIKNCMVAALDYGANAATILIPVYIISSFHAGKELNSLYNEIKNYLSFLTKNKLLRFYNTASATICLVEILKVPQETSILLISESFDETKQLPKAIRENDKLSCASIYFNKFMLAYFLRDFDEALLNAELTEKYSEGAVSKLRKIIFYFHYGLTLVQKLNEQKFLKRRKMMSKILKFEKQLKKYSKFMKRNFFQYYCFLHAEIMRVSGKPYEAINFYEKGIEFSHKNKFLQYEALGYELLGRNFWELSLKDLAKTCIKKAYWHYGKWGAKAKQKYLELEFSEKIDFGIDANFFIQKLDNLETTTSSTTIETLDLKSILNISEALSSEINLEKVLVKVLQTLYTTSGAEKIALLLEREGKLYIEAMKETEVGEIHILESIPVDNSVKDILPLPIITYVYSDRESIILDDALSDALYSKNNYISRKKIRSIVCQPLFKQNKLIGLLYLENNKTTNAFARTSVEVLKALSSHIAMAIENAELYTNILKISSAYERFVPKNFLALLEKKKITDVILGDKIRKNMSVLFADVRDFTSLLEKTDPEKVVDLLNGLISYMEPVIDKHHGFIDKYVGDEIMALFPLKIENALDASIEMQHALDVFNKEFKFIEKNRIRIGIGINFGSMLLCTIGDKVRMESTVISDAVNIASRLEKLTKLYQSPVLITEEVVQNLEDKQNYLLRAIDKIIIRGRTKPTIVYEVVNALPYEKIEKIKGVLYAFNQGWDMYQIGDFLNAQNYFNRVLNVMEDEVSRVLISRCTDLIKNGKPDNWNGVY